MTLEDWLDYKIIALSDFSVSLGQILLFAFIIVATLATSRLIRSQIRVIPIKERAISRAQLYAIGRFVHYIILIVGFVIALSVLGVNFNKLAILAGALGIGIGLGLQSLVNNFVSGLVILLEKSLKVGDFIELESGVVGEVIEIAMRATIIHTRDNVDILIPNAELTGGRVINWTLEDDIRRFRIPFSVAYGSDKVLVQKAALEAAYSIAYTLKSPGREAQVLMTGFGESALDFILAVWVTPEFVKQPTKLTSDYLWAIDDAFRRHQIEIPFPQRDIHFRNALQSEPSHKNI